MTLPVFPGVRGAAPSPALPAVAPPSGGPRAALSRAAPAGQEAARDPAAVARRALLSEVFAVTAADAAVTGFVLAHLPRASDRGLGTVLWAQDRLSLHEAGRPFLRGMASLTGPAAGQGGGGGLDMLRVRANRPVDVLVALEEGLGTKGLSAVVGEIWGDPAALDFTATKRLAMRAEAAGMPCWLIRRAGQPALSAARNRWRLASLPSARHPDDPGAPGAPRWRAELFRSRYAAPGAWAVEMTPRGARFVPLASEAAETPPQDAQQAQALPDWAFAAKRAQA